MNTIASEPLQDILPPDIVHLGFGCGGLLRGLSRSKSLFLLETAMDCGITYFDTARMYGDGDAEGILGIIAKQRRERLIIASKAGILPRSRSVRLRAINRGAQLLRKAVPQLKDHVPTPAALQLRVGVFDVPNVRKSVETSLRQLRTDYIDVLLLHECTEVDVENGELLYFLHEIKKQGKIRAFGVATGIQETIKISQSRPSLRFIVQIASSIWNMNVKRLPPRTEGFTIIHSILTSRFHELTRRLSSDASLAKQWQAAVQIDPHDRNALARLLLAHALQINREGMVLFSSVNPENIRASARVATESAIYADRIDKLNALIIDNHQVLSLEGIHRDHLSVS